MEQHKGFWFPDNNKATADAIFLEWNTKSEAVLGLVKKFDCCIQAGCNVGVFASNLADHFKKVVTFEPDSDNQECIKANNLPENVEVYFGAIGDEVGEVSIKREKGNCGATQIKEGTGVKMYRIDDLKLKPSLIWLDIEGYEYKALEGAKETIAKYNPVIVLENKGLIPDFGGNLNGSEKLVDYMTSLGYTRVSRMMRDDIYVHA